MIKLKNLITEGNNREEIEQLVKDAVEKYLKGKAKGTNNMGWSMYQINTKDKEGVEKVLSAAPKLKKYDPFYYGALDAIIIGVPGAQIKVNLKKIGSGLIGIIG
jgi:hypothetical protein